MEDALISPESFMILSGAGLIDASSERTIKQHTTETVDENGIFVSADKKSFFVHLSEKPYLPTDKQDNMAYAMFVNKGEIVTEPYIPVHGTDGTPLNEAATAENLATAFDEGVGLVQDQTAGYWICVKKGKNYVNDASKDYDIDDVDKSALLFDSVLVDYYVERASGAKQIEITPDKFGGNYYLEASTLWRDTDGVDWPAEFIIPNCKIQSNFTFTMASSGDPSTFTFTMDAFPDYTKFDKTQKVFSAIQVIQPAGASELIREKTAHPAKHETQF